MRSINRVVLCGNLGRDAEVKFTQSGIDRTTFSLATTHGWKVGDEWKNEVSWHNIIAWRIKDHKDSALLKKGNMFYVEGRVQNRSYDDKDGNKRFVSEVIAETIMFAGKPSGSGPRDEDAPPERSHSGAGAQQQDNAITDEGVPF
jgi:single-strand DNA-binding protein